MDGPRGVNSLGSLRRKVQLGFIDKNDASCVILDGKAPKHGDDFDLAGA